MSKIVRKIKIIVKEIPCLSMPDSKTSLIIETKASELEYGGILKQVLPNSLKEQITFLIMIDCKAALSMLKNDVKNLAILSCFDFSIEHIKSESNASPDFLTREFL
ncbi:hypothetical protein AHAS_Ahas09G0057600 [Arachis hypogaea]